MRISDWSSDVCSSDLNVFPPIPSEVILPLAGYTAAQGRGSLWVVAIAGTLGSAAGAVLWYYVGRWIGIERLKRFASRQGRWRSEARRVGKGWVSTCRDR